MIATSLLIQNLTDVVSLADCARACLENNLAGGGCRAWDWYSSVCELASAGLSTGIANTDETRPQVSIAFYGEPYVPASTTTGYSVREITNCAVTGATQTGASSVVADESSCETLCATQNWGTGPVTTAPTACGSWTYQLSTKTCTLYGVSSSTQCTPSTGYISGLIVNQNNVITELDCPTGYQATTGGVTCPFINDYGNTRASYVIEDSPVTNMNTGLNTGWQGMCTYSDTFTDFTGNNLDSQIYYNPIQLSVTCCM